MFLVRSRRPWGALGVVLALGALAAPERPARAQMASEAATVSQTVAGTELSVAYSRPRARGRRGLFGTTVRWGEVWTPGANQATTFRTTRDVTIEGTAVPKGRYSVWLIPAAGPTWELVLDRDTTLFHTQRPRPRAGQIRFPVRHETRPFAEVLTWSFPEVRGDGTTLVMQWDTVAVPLRVAVAPGLTRAVAPAAAPHAAAPHAARRVAGRHRFDWSPMPDAVPGRPRTPAPPRGSRRAPTAPPPRRPLAA